MNLPTRETDATFTDLICADQQWLREEFDALISASFGEPPSPPRSAPPPVPPRPARPCPPSWRPAAGPVETTFPAARPAHGRQRSPPASPAGHRAAAPAGT
jgi:hypothetical protein